MGNAFQKLYSGDGKPTVDAERKTSLGRDWHPTCLKCSECGKVLSPGQHAEHKGNPYCHTPCYKALFGPSLLGYGSNLASPANFARKEPTADYADEELPVQKREIYSNSGAAAARRQNLQRRSAPEVFVRSPTSGLPSAVDGEQDWNGKGKLFHSGQALSPSTTAAAASATLWPGLRPDGSQHCRSVSVDSAPCESAKSAGSAAAVAPVWVPRDSPRGRGKAWQTKNGSAESGYGSGTVRSNSMRLTHASNGSPSLGSAATWRTTRGSNSSSDAADDELFLMHSHRDERLGPHLIYTTVSRVNGCVKPPVNGLCGLDVPNIELADILDKVELFNSHYEGKVHHQMTVEKLPSGEVKIQGPLRIYWGLSRPIQLRHCDDVPTPPIAKWRHSLCANVNDGPVQNSSTPNKLHVHEGPEFHFPYRPMRGIDDSILMSPVSPDDVVMRKKVRKFNTVAYRSDAPTKWKRASINGHIFNYDTSVFTPVLGSSTSVIANSTMTSPLVIATLLDKFKVENSAKDYVLSVVTEKGDQTSEHVLSEGDHPLLERLQLGADESNAKIFLKERMLEPQVTVPETVKLPIMEEEEEEETLPAEVEQLMILPIAVLKGILIKYEKDEEREARLLKARYERAKRKIRQRLEELQTA